jgi:two-component system response regulator FlrC
MDLGLQAKLLRVIQEREVERLGSNKAVNLDVRLIATTNRNLNLEVQAGRFREDLFYRLNVFPLPLPALRERIGDIGPLVQRFIDAAGGDGNIRLDATAHALLTAHKWPGNVRELENVIQRALILCRNGVITAQDLILEPACVTAATTWLPQAQSPHAATAGGPLETDLRTREKNIIIDAVNNNATRKKAAETLGISPRTLRYKMARFRKQGLALPA